VNKSCRHVFFLLFNVNRRVRVRAGALPTRRTPAVEAQPVAATRESDAPAAPVAAPPKQRRTRKPTCLTVDRRFRYTSEPKGETVPLLRMSGRWLEEHGLSIGGNVYVEAKEGRLILTNDDARSADLMESRA